MDATTKGQVVSLKINGDTVYGWVRTKPTATACGDVVSVELLPDFSWMLATGWTDVNVGELESAAPCACAQLGYRRDGRVFTTGCDFSRKPKGRFLPGHDAKAKALLIKAWGYSMFGGFEHSLAAAWTLSDNIAAHVAKGIDNARNRSQKRASSKRRQVEREERPAAREDQLTDAQRLQRDLKVTDPMIEALARGLTQWDGEVVGTPTGTALAMQKRGLVEKGGQGITELGRRVMDYDLEPAKPVCVASSEYADPGVYPSHRITWDYEGGHCRRCGHIADDQ